MKEKDVDTYEAMICGAVKVISVPLARGVRDDPVKEQQCTKQQLVAGYFLCISPKFKTHD